MPINFFFSLHCGSFGVVGMRDAIRNTFNFHLLLLLLFKKLQQAIQFRTWELLATSFHQIQNCAVRPIDSFHFPDHKTKQPTILLMGSLYSYVYFPCFPLISPPGLLMSERTSPRFLKQFNVLLAEVRGWMNHYLHRTILSEFETSEHVQLASLQVQASSIKHENSIFQWVVGWPDKKKQK